MDKPITTISGIISCYIFNYNNQMFYFFGDKHFGRENNCQEKGYKCDYFNTTFTKTFTYHTECTNIGVMLHNWFVYNNDHNIKTNFYLEEYYTKKDKRTQNQYYYNVINNRRLYDYYDQTNAPFKNSSWMEMMSYILEPCLVKNKLNCPYYPNVHVHYIDVRVIEENKKTEVTPFSLSLALKYIKSNQLQSFEDYQLIKSNILTLIKFIINHYNELLDIMFEVDGYQQLYHHINQPLFEDIIDNVNLFTVTKNINGKMMTMYKTAWELYRLSLIDEVLSNDIKDYIKQIGTNIIYNIMLKFKQDYKSLNVSLSNDKLILSIYQKILEQWTEKYDSLLIDLQSLSMDAYTLARLFLQNDGQDVIVYTGDYHTKIYIDFFKIYLTQPLVDYPSQNDERCVIINNLTNYIDANTHRNYVVNL